MKARREPPLDFGTILVVINTLTEKKKKKKPRTGAQKYEHLGSLYFGRGSDIAGSPVCCRWPHDRQLRHA